MGVLTIRILAMYLVRLADWALLMLLMRFTEKVEHSKQMRLGDTQAIVPELGASMGNQTSSNMRQ